MGRHQSVSCRNSIIPRGRNARTDQIEMGEIGETPHESTRFEKLPIQDLQGPNQSTLETQPPLAYQRAGAAMRLWDLGEDEKQKLVGEDGGEVLRIRRLQGETMETHLESDMFEGGLFFEPVVGGDRRPRLRVRVSLRREGHLRLGLVFQIFDGDCSPSRSLSRLRSVASLAGICTIFFLSLEIDDNYEETTAEPIDDMV